MCPQWLCPCFHQMGPFCELFESNQNDWELAKPCAILLSRLWSGLFLESSWEKVERKREEQSGRQTARHSDKVWGGEWGSLSRTSRVEMGREGRRGMGRPRLGVGMPERQTDSPPNQGTGRTSHAQCEIEMQRHQPRQSVGRDRWQRVPGRCGSNHAH